MYLRTFVSLAALCFLCGATGTHAQNGLGKAKDHYQPLKKCWEYAVENPDRASVGLLNGTVFIAESEGRIRAVDAQTGIVNWVTELGGRVTGMRAVAGIGVAVVTS